MDKDTDKYINQNVSLQISRSFNSIRHEGMQSKHTESAIEGKTHNIKKSMYTNGQSMIRITIKRAESFSRGCETGLSTITTLFSFTFMNQWNDQNNHSSRVYSRTRTSCTTSVRPYKTERNQEGPSAPSKHLSKFCPIRIWLKTCHSLLEHHMSVKSWILCWSDLQAEFSSEEHNQAKYWIILRDEQNILWKPLNMSDLVI